VGRVRCERRETFNGMEEACVSLVTNRSSSMEGIKSSIFPGRELAANSIS
jgi:hypothetical protein